MFEVFGQFVGQILGGAKPQDPFWIELKDWVSALAQHSVHKWHAVISSGIPCSCGACSRPAVGGCILCNKPACLAHSFVSFDANIACFVCMRRVTSNSYGSPGPHGPPGAAPPSPEEIRKKHLKTLGLKPGAAVSDIKRAFKAVAAKHHPDRAPESKKAAAEKKMKEVTQAYQWLMANTAES